MHQQNNGRPSSLTKHVSLILGTFSLDPVLPSSILTHLVSRPPEPPGEMEGLGHLAPGQQHSRGILDRHGTKRHDALSEVDIDINSEGS